MLEMRPNCERCDQDLAADSNDAFICSFECTFCRDCTENQFQHNCPNCTGRLFLRPTRSANLWNQYPPSTRRILK